MDWTLGTILTQMDKDEYHFPLALLLTEQAIRESNKDEAISRRHGGQGGAADRCLVTALTALKSFVTRDGDRGTLRTLNVFRLAAGLKDFPASTLAIAFDTPFVDVWAWFKAQAANVTPQPFTTTGFLETLRTARQEGSGEAVWERLAEASGTLFSLGAMPETWKRILAVEALLKE